MKPLPGTYSLAERKAQLQILYLIEEETRERFHFSQPAFLADRNFIESKVLAEVLESLRALLGEAPPGEVRLTREP